MSRPPDAGTDIAAIGLNGDDGGATEPAPPSNVPVWDHLSGTVNCLGLGAAAPRGSVMAVVALADRGVAIAGRLGGKVDLGHGQLDTDSKAAFVAVFDQRGRSLWARTFATGLAASVDSVDDPKLATTSDGGLVVVAAGFERAADGVVHDFATVTGLSLAGDLRWQRGFDEPPSGLATTKEGSWLALGKSLVLLDATGAELRRADLGGFLPTHISADPEGALMLAGVVEEHLGPVGNTCAVESRSPTGSLIWTRTFGGRYLVNLRLAGDQTGARWAVVGRSDAGPVDWQGEGRLASESGSFPFLFTFNRDGGLLGRSIVRNLTQADDVAWWGSTVVASGASGQGAGASVAFSRFDAQAAQLGHIAFQGFGENSYALISPVGNDLFIAGTSDVRRVADSGGCFQPRPFAFRIDRDGRVDPGFASFRP